MMAVRQPLSGGEILRWRQAHGILTMLLGIVVLAAIVLGSGAAAPAGANEKTGDIDPILHYTQTLPRPRPVQDWLTPERPNEMPAYPSHGLLVNQNPPAFRWRWETDDSSYQVQIRATEENARAIQRFTANNFLLLDQPLKPGTYRWRVRRWAPGGEPGKWSRQRVFTVNPHAHEFTAPSVSTAWKKVVKLRRPRALPPKPEYKAIVKELRRGSRKKVFKKLVKDLGNWPDKELDPEPPTATFEVEDFYERIRVARFINQVVNRATIQLSKALYTWFIDREDAQLGEVWRRSKHLISWDPEHSTGVRSSDLSNLRIALALALVYDMTHKQMTPEDRALTLRMIEYRTQAAFDHYIIKPGRALERKPFNSHGFRINGGIAAIATLLARDSHRAKVWFYQTYPTLLAINNPWGGEDGGFGNGVNYGVFDTLNNMQYWDILKNTTGVDVTRMSWPQEVGMFFSYFIPPGTPASAFGDGGERFIPNAWGLVAQLYQQRINSKVARRFAAQWETDNQEYFGYLFGPKFDPVNRPFNQKQHIKLPDTAVFPSIGWVAMHSDLNDPDRATILFKSSVYGSYNHSHADQNSFIIHFRQKRMAIDSGYYDTYKSAHHAQWTMLTKAHNAITFDGGLGQKEQDRSAQGTITNYARCGTFDLAIGDATPAYKGELEKAVRSVMYLRPGLALIYDDLRSGTARTWEWNLHALKEISQPTENGARIEVDGAAVCFQILDAPETEFSQTSEFPADPDEFFVPDWTKQWHATFASAERSTAAEFLVAVDIGCQGINASEIKRQARGGYTLNINNHQVTLNARTGNARRLGPSSAETCPVPPYKN